MSQPEIRFDNGAEYEEFMGIWSRLVGDRFLDWLAPLPGGRWVDVGCGNGAFTELLVARCSPREVQGIDPSEGQIAFARGRMPDAPVRFEQGDAMALPYADAAFDAAVMALVIFFVPEPARGVAEMARVVRPGGSVSAYAWDILGGGFPFAALQQEMEALGVTPLWPPSVEASRIDAMHASWTGAGLVDVETCELRCERTFESFESFWRIALTGPRMAPRIAAMPLDEVERLKDRLRQRLRADAEGRITYEASANAVKGVVPRR
jgi:ubiquinone/menaquinone biosynthesis C-methylase UbiE